MSDIHEKILERIKFKADRGHEGVSERDFINDLPEYTEGQVSSAITDLYNLRIIDMRVSSHNNSRVKKYFIPDELSELEKLIKWHVPFHAISEMLGGQNV